MKGAVGTYLGGALSRAPPLMIGSNGRDTMEADTAGRKQGRRASAVMEPLPARLALGHSVAAARELMWACGLSFMVVVAPVTGKLLGVVLRRTLERRCEARGHDPETCMLVRHVKTDVDFCLEDELVDEVFGNTPTTIAPRSEQGATPEARRRNALPVIVVDEYKVPVGLLRRPKPVSPVETGRTPSA